jgi:hypothetical protein
MLKQLWCGALPLRKVIIFWGLGGVLLCGLVEEGVILPLIDYLGVPRTSYPYRLPIIAWSLFYVPALWRTIGKYKGSKAGKILACVFAAWMISSVIFLALAAGWGMTHSPPSH